MRFAGSDAVSGGIATVLGDGVPHPLRSSTAPGQLGPQNVRSHCRVDTYEGAPKASRHHRIRHHRIQFLGILLGAGAIVAMTTFAVAQSDSEPGGIDVPLAGSGDAPANTTYKQPVVGQMKIGNTATATTSVAGPAG